MLSDFASMRACVISKHQPRGASQRSVPGESENTCLKGERSKEAVPCKLLLTMLTLMIDPEHKYKSIHHTADVILLSPLTKKGITIHKPSQDGPYLQRLCALL